MTAMQYFWRGIEVPDTVRTRVESCTDLDLLTTWSERAVHATTAHDLFGDERP